MKTKLRFVSSESVTYLDIDDLISCANTSDGVIPAACIHYENGETNLFSNPIAAIDSAYLLKAVGKKIKLDIFIPEIKENGNIIIITNRYE